MYRISATEGVKGFPRYFHSLSDALEEIELLIGEHINQYYLEVHGDNREYSVIIKRLACYLDNGSSALFRDGDISYIIRKMSPSS